VTLLVILILAAIALVLAYIPAGPIDDEEGE
jgi:hypothetical protein